MSLIETVFNRRVVSGWAYALVTMISGMAVLAAAAKFLTISDAGFWFFFQTCGAFVSLGEMGMTYVLMRKTSALYPPDVLRSRSLANARDTVPVGIKWTARKIRGISIVASSCLAAAFGIIVIYQSSSTDMTTQEVLISWAVFSLGICLQVAAQPQKGVLEAAGLLHIERWVASFSHLINTCAVIGAAIVTQSVLIMCIASLVLPIIYTSAILILGQKLWIKGKDQQDVGEATYPVAPIWKEGLGITWINLGATVTRSSYVVIVGGMLGAAAVAPIFFVSRLFSVASGLIGILATSDRSVIASMHSVNDPKLKEFIGTKLLVSLVLSIFAAIFIWIFNFNIVSVLFGSNYVASTAVLIILSIDILLGSVTSACAQFVLAFGKNPFRLSVPISGVVTLLALFVLVPPFGLAGAAAAQLIGGALTSYWYNVFILSKEIRVRRT